METKAGLITMPSSLMLPGDELSAHLFSYQIFIGTLLCVRHCARL